ncbi:unnamed protein product [Ixodes persulcatus]
MEKSAPERFRRVIRVSAATSRDFESNREHHREDNNWLEMLFKELLVALKIHGIVIFKPDPNSVAPRKGNAKSLLRNVSPSVILLVVSTSYGIHYAASSFTSLGRNPNGLLSLFSDVAYLFRIATALFTAYYMTSVSTSVSSLLSDSTTIFQKTLPKNAIKSIRGYVIGMSVFAFANLLAFLGVKLTELYQSGFDGYYNYNLYDLAPESKSVIYYAVPALDIAFCTIIITMPKWIMGFHVSVCKYLGCQAVSLSGTFASERVVVLKRAREFREYHAALCELIFRFDEIFNLVLFFWYADIIISFVLSVPYIIIRTDNSTPWTYAFVMVDVACNVALLVVFNMAASDPGRLARDAQLVVLKMSSRADPDDVRLNHELLLLANAVKVAKVEMSGWNCFDVQRGLTITVLSMLSTYVVIVYQMMHHTF